MNTVRELLPVGLGVAVVAAVTYAALDREWAVGPWLLGLLLFAHGWVHLMWLFPAPDRSERGSGGTAYPFSIADSWPVASARLDESVVRTVALTLIGLTFAAFLLAALATVGWLVPTEWWGSLVVGAAGLSTVTLAVLFSPMLLLGFAINAGLVWLVSAAAWTP